MTARTLVVLVTLALANVAHAQSTDFDGIGRCMQSLQTLMPTRFPPTDDEMRRMMDALTRCGWEIVKAKLTQAEAQALANIDIKFEEGGGPAARVRGKTIYVSYDGFAQAGQVGQVVGHDIFVDDGNEFPVPSKVAYAPLATQPIVGLTSRLSGWIDNAAAGTTCQLDDCKMVQGLAVFFGVEGFLLAHEAAHVVLGHANTAADRNELDADRWAYALMRRFDTDFEETDVSRLGRTAARLAPVIYFDYLHSRLATEQQMEGSSTELALLQRRREQLVGLTDKDARLTLDTLSPSVDIGVGRVAISVDGDVEGAARFWIDGVPLSASDVLGQERVVGAGLRHIAARSNGRFAYVTEFISPGERKSVRLRFSTPLASVSTAEIEQMVKARAKDGEEKWAQIFLRTTTAAGEPRSPDVAMYHYQSLAMMKLGALIPSAPAGITDARALRNINRWRERARPLVEWW
jgi:hypothetical protein